jgi:hypothetical protein
MWAKVRNFYIFDEDEIDIEESPRLPVCIQRCLNLLPALAFFLFFVAKTFPVSRVEWLTAYLGFYQLGHCWLFLQV